MTAWLGARRVHHDQCGSTNDEALALARGGAAHGTVVTAGAQIAGRGRAGRAWHSPPGRHVYLSIVLRPALPAAALPGIALAAGVGVCDAVRRAGVRRARLKWPNDVLVGERKLAGILTESTLKAGQPPIVVVGIGVDVDGRADEWPPELAAIATSIREETDAPHDVAAFTGALLDAIEPWLDAYLAGGIAAIAEAWEERAELGAAVRVVTSDGERTGVALGLDDTGALRVEVDGGDEIRVIAGDVVEIPRVPSRR